MQIGGSSTLSTLQKLTIKRIITYVLIAMLYIVVVLSMIDVGYTLYKDIVTPPLFVIEADQLLDLLGLFLLVLVAIELLDTVQAYLNENAVHAEVVMEAAMIAVARKIIILDIKQVTPVTIIGIGVILIALAFGYWIVKALHGSHTLHFPGKS